MRTTLVPLSTCACGAVLDAATDMRTKETPSAGDLSVCLQCGRVSQFNAQLVLEPVDDAALDLDAATRAKLARYRTAILATRPS